ncbi:MAG: hypothetical protein ACSLFL_04290 [Alphaproteobacteria bacterium]
MMIRLFVALLLFAAVPVMAAEDQAPAMPQLAQQQVRDTLLEQLQMQAREAQTRADEAERRERDAEIQRLADEASQAQTGLGQAEQRARDAELRQLVLQAKSDLEDKAYSRLENLLTAFGILLTGIIIFFSLSTKEAAIAAAKSGVEDIRERVEKTWREIDKVALKIKETQKDAEASAAGIIEQAAVVSQILTNLPPGEVPEFEDDREIIANAAKEASAKKPRDRTSLDYRALISYLLAQEKWSEMLTAAQQMRLLHDED